MRVIIYAAGVSRRLKSIVGNGLKGLLQMGGKRLIEYQLDWISEHGISDVVIVLGLEHELYKEVLGSSYKDTEITYVYNPDYRDKGNMLSLWYAREYCDTDTIFTTSDLVCNYDDINKFVNSPAADKILVDSKSTELFHDPDPVKVSILDGKITNIKKQNKELNTIDGVAIGLYKFSSSGIRSIIASIEQKIDAGNDDLSLYYAIDNVLKMRDVVPVYAEICQWADVDTPEDLVIAKNLMY